MAEYEWRCRGQDPTKAEPCGKLLGKFEDLRRGSIRCPRCKHLNTVVWPSGQPEPSPVKQFGVR